MGAHFLWRQSVQDGTYSPGAVEMRPQPGLAFFSAEKALGALYMLQTNFILEKYYSIALDVSQFLAGSYVKETGRGKDITYLSLKVSYKF